MWCNCSIQEQDKIENVQLEAAPIVTEAVKGTHHCELYKETKWTTLGTRRTNNMLILMHKMVYRLTPQYLSLLLPPPRNSGYDTRLRDNIVPIFARTDLYMNSFLPKTINKWNNLDVNTRSILTTNAFKYFLKNKAKSPKYYNIGNRQAQNFNLSCKNENVM